MSGKAFTENPEEVRRRYPRTFARFPRFGLAAKPPVGNLKNESIALAVLMMAEKRPWDLVDRSRAAVDIRKVKDGDEFHARQCKELAKLLRPLCNRDMLRSA